MKELKNIPLFLIPYLTVCGALYHISYWDTFGINGLAFITISDIIKSSAYPFLSTAFFLFLGMFIGVFFNPLEKYLPKGQGKNTQVGKKVTSKIGMTIIFILWVFVLLLIPHFGTRPARWLAFGFLAALPPAIWLDTTGIWSDTFTNNRVRLMVFEILFYLPVFAFSIGKYNSELIYRNQTYKYTISQSQKANQEWNGIDTIKLLGVTEKHFIFSDLKNSKTVFFKYDNIDTLILLNKK